MVRSSGEEVEDGEKATIVERRSAKLKVGRLFCFGVMISWEGWTLGLEGDSEGSEGVVPLVEVNEGGSKAPASARR